MWGQNTGYGPYEALTFQDHLGRRVHMVFGGGGRLMIDGDVVGTFDTTTRRVANLAERLKTGRSPIADYVRPLTP